MHTFDRKGEEKNLKAIKAAFIAKCTDLLKLSLDDFSGIFDKYFLEKNERETIIAELDKYPEDLLKLLEKILAEKIVLLEANSEDSSKINISDLLLKNFTTLHILKRD